MVGVYYSPQIRRVVRVCLHHPGATQGCHLETRWLSLLLSAHHVLKNAM